MVYSERLGVTSLTKQDSGGGLGFVVMIFGSKEDHTCLFKGLTIGWEAVKS